MRRWGPSGGGTLRRGSPQLLQRSLPEMLARSQWPRASHCGLMHCTVQPGRYCMIPPECSFVCLGRAGLPCRKGPLPTVTRLMARILPQPSCGVKRKPTIPCGTVARTGGSCSSVLARGRHAAGRFNAASLRTFLKRRAAAPRRKKWQILQVESSISVDLCPVSAPCVRGLAASHCSL